MEAREGQAGETLGGAGPVLNDQGGQARPVSGSWAAVSRRVTISRAQYLRANMTRVEQRVWKELRARQLGVKFRRQHPIGPFIADFACCSSKLVVELDGDTHFEAYDERRDRQLELEGWRVMRVDLKEVDEDIDAVIDAIRLELAEPHTMLTPASRLGLSSFLPDLTGPS